LGRFGRTCKIIVMRWGIYKESTRRVVGVVKDKLSGYGYNEREDSVEGGEAEEELEVVGDPRWDKINNRFRGMMGVKDRAEKPEFQRWNKRRIGEERHGKRLQNRLFRRLLVKGFMGCCYVQKIQLY
jgi:21S rRNA (GM2251-2'-O)-methyltransferase